jgi:holin-like protein
MHLLNGITLLLVYQLLGETAVRLMAIPVPGPVLGMLMLFVTLLIRGAVPKSVDSAATGLLTHLSLLFIPAGVGLLVHLERIGEEWLPITLALLFSTIITMATTAAVVMATHRLISKWRHRDV